MQDATMREALDAVEKWNAAWAARDLDRMRQLAADDYIQWHATIRKDFSKDEEFAMLVEALKVMRIKFRDVRLTPLGGGKVLQQCLGDISVEGAGERDGVPFAMVFQTRGGFITRCDEYMDGRSLPAIEFTPRN